jgi:hypothetical protein
MARASSLWTAASGNANGDLEDTHHVSLGMIVVLPQ